MHGLVRQVARRRLGGGRNNAKKKWETSRGTNPHLVCLGRVVEIGELGPMVVGIIVQHARRRAERPSAPG
jgi:hypothetical protein